MKLFCKHVWKYKFIDECYPIYMMGFPDKTLVYQCEKCRKFTKLSVAILKNEMNKYRYRMNDDYYVSEIVFPGRYIDRIYRGKYVGHFLSDYRKKGFDLTEYANRR